jgi:branched-chain amino acid transport system substrate-binding protein
VVWGAILTIAQVMHKITYPKLSTSTISAAVKSFRGPLLLGGPDIQCGRYKFAPGSCSDANDFFHYRGGGKYFRSSRIEEPAAPRKRLEALQPGAGFPTG